VRLRVSETKCPPRGPKNVPTFPRRVSPPVGDISEHCACAMKSPGAGTSSTATSSVRKQQRNHRSPRHRNRRSLRRLVLESRPRAPSGIIVWNHHLRSLGIAKIIVCRAPSGDPSESRSPRPPKSSLVLESRPPRAVRNHRFPRRRTATHRNPRRSKRARLASTKTGRLGEMIISISATLPASGRFRAMVYSKGDKVDVYTSTRRGATEPRKGRSMWMPGTVSEASPIGGRAIGLCALVPRGELLHEFG